MALFTPGEGFHKLSDSLKYVNDYETELYTDERGKTKERITYIGPMIRLMGNNDVSKRKFILISMLAVLEAASVLYATFMNHATAWWAFTTIPMAIALFPSLYMLMGVMKLPFKGAPMKRDRYMHGIIRVYRSAATVSVLNTTVLLAECVYRTIYDDWLFLKDDIMFLVLEIGAILLCAANILLLRSVPVDERELNNEM